MNNNFKARIDALRGGTLRLSVVKDPDTCMRIVGGMSKNFDAVEQSFNILECENTELKRKIRTLTSLLPADVVAILE